MAGTIIFNSINVNGLQTNSAVFVGETSAPSWSSHNKKQASTMTTLAAFGGNNLYPGNLYLLSDNDIVDTVINDNDIQNTASKQV